MKIKCPECGECLDSEKVDFVKHASLHWGVKPHDLDSLRNSEAKRRYNVLLEAAKKAALEEDMIEPKIPDIKAHVAKGGAN